jgi:hypothetical protein
MRWVLSAMMIILTALAGIVLATDGPEPTAAQFQPTAPPLVTVTPIPTNPFLATPTPEPTSALIFTPPPTSRAPGCDEQLPLQIGATVTVRSGISIRLGPSVSTPLLEYLVSDRVFIVQDGPVCSDNYIWWAVRSAGLSGWVAERNTNILFIRGFDNPIPLDCNTPLPLTVGETVPLDFNVRIRLEPDADSRVLTVAQADSTARILSEPICAGGFNWRLVRVEVVGVTYEGYIAEGERSDIATTDFFDLPQEPLCYPPLALAAGDRVRVYYRSGPPKALRAGPSDQADLLYTLVSGVPLEITGESVCVDGLNWWPVRVLSSIPAGGWIAEGGRPIPSIRPFDEPPLPLPGR